MLYRQIGRVILSKSSSDHVPPGRGLFFVKKNRAG